MHTLRAIPSILAAAVLGISSVCAQVVAPTPGRIINFSVRAFSGNGGEVLIAGFSLSGTSTRPLLLRAVGPGLAPFGVANYMVDPELRLFHTPTQEMTNDSWGENINLADLQRRLGAFDLAENSRDAAVLIPLAPGSYTAHARGRNGTTGEVLLEMYDAAEITEGAPAIVNVSLRGQVAQNGLIIGGFVISPGAPKRIVLRAIGPSLAQFNVPGALGNPRVRLYSGSNVILQNDDWTNGNNATDAENAFQLVGAFPISRTSKDAAIIASLPPGAYTAHVDDPTGGSGIVLMEIYDMEPPSPGDPVSSPPGTGPLPGISVVALSNAMVEGTTPGTTVMLIRTGDLSRALRVKLTSAGTAAANDHSGIPDAITFPVGSATTTFVFGAWADNTWEPSEVLTISLVPDAAYQIQGGGKTDVVIRDNSPLNGTGWQGDYFSNNSLTGAPTLTRTDAQINFDWLAGSPAPSIPANNFSVRWTGLLQVDTTQDYIFTTRTDDGVRLYIDDQLLINRFVAQGRTDYTATKRLAAGVRYRVRMEYLETTGNASAILFWQAAGMPRTVVPTNRVFVGNTSAPAITSGTSAFALAGGPFTYTITASAAPTSFGATGLPAGLSINTTTGVISGTPTVAGSYPVILTAINAQGTAAELLSLQVASTGTPPVSETWLAATPGLVAPTTPPSATTPLSTLESNAPAGTAFERIRGYITAQYTGNYTFFVTTTGPSEFHLADSDQPGDKWLRARVQTGFAAGNWVGEPGQRSMQIALTAGKRYYFELLHRPGAGASHAAVGWLRPGETTATPTEIVPAYTLSRFNELTTDQDGRALYLASLRPPDGVASPASGTVSLLFDGTTNTATLSMRFTGLSSAQVAAYLYVGPIGATGPLIQALPNGQFTGFEWQLRASGSLTIQDIAGALRDGLLYVVVHTGNFPEGELRGQFGAATGSARFTAPAAPPTFSLTLPNAAAASRFLNQATFGATQTDIDHVLQVGIPAWLDEQFNLPASYHLPYMDAKIAEYALLTPPSFISQDDRQRVWWERAVRAPDQLRQRVALALSEIFVVSDIGGLSEQPIGLTVYYDLLLRNAFGNVRPLLEEVTLSPAMANYLSMIRNRKDDPARGIYPDENYAREVMQLFSIGLNKLHPDGTLVLDTNGLPIPSYSQEAIVGLAHVFTGWAYFSTSATPSYLGGSSDYRNPLMLFPAEHDTSDKRLLESIVLPGGTASTGAGDLAVVLDLLFQHPNIGPFLSKQLIQRLVTSNPSPGYVHRVAQVFANNGQGGRGDLKAVVRAILTDYEARDPRATTVQGYGKVREGLIRQTQLWRAFNGTATDGRFNYTNPQTNLNQAALRSPTVFNFFEPGYVQPGVLASAGLVAPEFQITSEITVVNLTNSLRSAVFTNVANVTLDLTAQQNLAGDPAALVDSLNTLLMGGSMSAGMRSTVITAVTSISATTPLERARTALNLITISPEFSIQK